MRHRPLAISYAVFTSPPPLYMSPDIHTLKKIIMPKNSYYAQPSSYGHHSCLIFCTPTGTRFPTPCTNSNNFSTDSALQLSSRALSPGPKCSPPTSPTPDITAFALFTIIFLATQRAH